MPCSIRSIYHLVLLLAVLSGAGCQQTAATRPAITPAAETTPGAEPAPRYVFGWGELAAELAKPRGGTTRGAPVTLAPAQTLPLPAIADAASAFERDRAAIHALAGDYRVSFHFMETLGLMTDSAPRKSYHSWATEHVRVIEDTGRFISLQHTLVMFMQQDDDTISEPMLVKHWRQDWTYEPAEVHEYRGDRTWARRRFTPVEAAGAWSQSVWHVDDSPRYAALGRWSHDGNRSLWTGDNTWRPLPRREHAMRSDYGVMEGAHRIVLTPTGWLHEQLNWKRVAGDSVAVASYVAEEWGLDRYERITAPGLIAADEYWTRTSGYWAAVRNVWRDVCAARDRFTLPTKFGGESLFEVHLGYADEIASDTKPYDAVAGERHARETIERFLAGKETAP